MSKSMKLSLLAIVILLIVSSQWLFENNEKPNSFVTPNTALVKNSVSSDNKNNSRGVMPGSQSNKEEPPQSSPPTEQDTNEKRATTDRVEDYKRLLKRLTSNGLPDSVSNQLFVRSDFLDIINSLEKTNSESYEVQQMYLDIIDQGISSGNLEMAINAFNCSDSVCGGGLFYENDEQVNAFVKATFFNKKSAAVAYKIQPVVQNGVKELRVLFSYKNPVIEVDSGS